MKPSPTDIDATPSAKADAAHRTHRLPILGTTTERTGAAPSHPPANNLITRALATLGARSVDHAIRKNYRRSVNAQIIIYSHRRRVVVAGKCRPGNRTGVVVARAAVAHLLTGERHVLGDHRCRAHRGITARVELVIARLKDWQILRQCRRRGDAINHTLQITAGLWNPKHAPMRLA